jgi:hypothetical protein
LAESATDKYRKALESAEGIKAAAVKELIEEIDGKITELNSFGFAYRLAKGAKTAPKRRAASSKEKYCSICNLTGHDARNHRNQEPKKKFSNKELDERGLPHA